MGSCFPRSRITDHWSLRLECLINDVGERRVTVEDVDVEPFVLERAHRVEPFLLSRASATHPYFHALELPFRLGLAESVDDAAEGLHHVGEIGNRPADDDVLDPRQ